MLFCTVFRGCPVSVRLAGFAVFLALYGIGCRISVQLAAPIDHAGKGKSRTPGWYRTNGGVQASPAARTIRHRDASLPVNRTLNMLPRNIFTADLMDNRRYPCTNCAS